MSKIEKPKYFFKKTLKVIILDHYALNHKKNNYNFVTIFFYKFFRKNLKLLSVETLWKL